MKCRGKESRKRIVKDYVISPIAHVKLLNGQQKSSCTNVTLTDNYYCFNYVSRTEPNDKGSFYCGSSAANDFLSLTKLAALPLFNPLVSNGVGGGGTGNTSSNSWNPSARQLNNAINMLVVCWNVVPGGPLARIQAQLIQNHNQQPSLSIIKAVNTIIGSRNGTLQQMITSLRATNNIRIFRFDLLNAVLNSNNIASNFG